MSGGWPWPRDESERVNLSPGNPSTQIFTVIHGGAEIDQDRALELLDVVSAWTVAAEPGVTRLVDMWAAPWHRLVVSCVATAAAFGGPVHYMHLPVADDLVARMKARGAAVRHRQARQEVVDDAELWAISHGWPVRYI